MTAKEEFLDDFFKIVDEMVFLMVQHGKDPKNEHVNQSIDNIGSKALASFVEKWGPKNGD